jgi:hypothetical protein
MLQNVIRSLYCDVYRPRALIWGHYTMLQNVLGLIVILLYRPEHWYEAQTILQNVIRSLYCDVYRPRALIWGHYSMLQNVLGLIVILYISRALIWGHYTMLQNVIRPCYCSPVYRPRALIWCITRCSKTSIMILNWDHNYWYDVFRLLSVQIRDHNGNRFYK